MYRLNKNTRSTFQPTARSTQLEKALKASIEKQKDYLISLQGEGTCLLELNKGKIELLKIMSEYLTGKETRVDTTGRLDVLLSRFN
jgi:hypothetical protein